MKPVVWIIGKTFLHGTRWLNLRLAPWRATVVPANKFEYRVVKSWADHKGCHWPSSIRENEKLQVQINL